jgi:hypothetical protein
MLAIGLLWSTCGATSDTCGAIWLPQLAMMRVRVAGDTYGVVGDHQQEGGKEIGHNR